MTDITDCDAETSQRDSLRDKVWTECQTLNLQTTAASICGGGALQPFHEIYFPLIAVARGLLIERMAIHSGLSEASILSEKAQKSLEESLLVQFVQISGMALMEVFDRSFSTARRTTLKLLGTVAGTAPTENYRAFIQHHLGNGWSELFDEFPVLLHLLTLAITHWVDSSEEFLCRLHKDLPVLGGHKAEMVFPSLSDPHNGRRMVSVVLLDTGKKVVYKPKSLDLEVAFDAFLGWINEQGLVPAFKRLAVVNFDAYGWTEHVDQSPCMDEASAVEYYERAGALLAVLYFLQATDCHRENLIANGKYPVLIDMETLLYPATKAESSAHAHITSELDAFMRSVIGTGMLPRWDFNINTGIVFDVSALGSVEPPPTPIRVPRLRNLNTDDMLLVYEHELAHIEKNVPILGNAPVRPEHHVEDMCSGFSSTYRFLLDRREHLLAGRSPLDLFQSLQARFLLRNTRVYHQLLGESFYPAKLRDFELWRKGFEILAQTGPGNDDGHSHVLFNWENAALQNLDVPCFLRWTDRTTIFTSQHQVIEDFFLETGCDRVRDRLRIASESDLDLQLQIIRGTFMSRVDIAQASVRASEPPRLAEPATLTDKVELLDEAVRLGDELIARRYQREDGFTGWMGIAYHPQLNCFQLQPVGEDLYEGKVGIGLTFAALAACTHAQRYRDAALETLAPARALRLHAKNAKLHLTHPEALGIGGITGVASLAYALAKAGALLGEDNLLEDALKMFEQISEQDICQDLRLDVMSGAAGTLLAMLAVHADCQEPELLRKAILCGDHLVRQCSPSASGHSAWLNPQGAALTGFSHGASGICLALARLAKSTGDSRYLEAVRLGLAFERSHYSPTFRNWRDLRKAAGVESEESYMNSWCNGAAGIGLARLALLGLVDDSQLSDELELARTTAGAYLGDDVDHLCCGNFGRLVLRWQSDIDPAQPFSADSSALADKILEARALGGYRLFHQLPRAAWNPGFFRGTSGIAYSLLRKVSPERLPDVLTLE